MDSLKSDSLKSLLVFDIKSFRLSFRFAFILRYKSSLRSKTEGF
ncbi:hypothetical protein HMPREF3230_00656 [Gardnerella vaginalis]|uniref:Uncharacterized protein n=1 Tax=Gardnerella vaginalis TaxID=2702 RepID=A0A135Z7Q7_GARVA|nr:hypothetical protein HMPREF3230_00656 [Gardnerella vaginalis]